MGVVVGLAIKASLQCALLFASPQVTEFRLLREQLDRAVASGAFSSRTAPIIARRMDADDAFAPLVLGDEFGAPSGLPAWGMRYQILAAIHLMGLDIARFTVIVREPDDSGEGVHVDGQRVRSTR